MFSRAYLITFTNFHMLQIDWRWDVNSFRFFTVFARLADYKQHSRCLCKVLFMLEEWKRWLENFSTELSCWSLTSYYNCCFPIFLYFAWIKKDENELALHIFFSVSNAWNNTCLHWKWNTEMKSYADFSEACDHKQKISGRNPFSDSLFLTGWICLV